MPALRSPFLHRCCAALLLGCVACAPQAPSSPAPASPAAVDSANLLARLRALSAAAACSETAQCRTVAVGAKACGGAEYYLPVSGANADQAAALAASYAEQRRAANAAAAGKGIVSDCSMVSDPGASCEAGICTLRSPGPGVRVD